MGRLGQALADYPSFDRQEFRLVAAFDVDPAVIGRRFGSMQVEPLDLLDQVARERAIDLAFLTVPAGAAQVAVDALGAAGVRGILNFAPIVVTAPEQVRVEAVDLSAGLQRLTYYVQSFPDAPGEVAG